MEDFDAFLIQKNIDPQAFKAKEIELFNRWAQEFSQYHSESFVMQKKFLINNIRRKYQLKK